MLPEKSQTSITKGIWFVHKDKFNTVKIFGSNTGKEMIYLNDELVSEQRNINLKSEHNFDDKNNNKYNIQFITTNLMKGEMDCLIHRNNEEIKSFKTSFRRDKNFTINRFLILILSSVAFAFLSKHFELPDFAFYIFLAAILGIHFVTRDPGEILITEDEKITNA